MRLKIPKIKRIETPEIKTIQAVQRLIKISKNKKIRREIINIRLISLSAKKVREIAKGKRKAMNIEREFRVPMVLKEANLAKFQGRRNLPKIWKIENKVTKAPEITKRKRSRKMSLFLVKTFAIKK